MKQIRTEITINASPERVWELLTDFAAYARWNPFIPQAQGEPNLGQTLEVKIQPPDAQGMTFRPTVIKAEPNRELPWLGRLGIPGLFDGEHRFVLESWGDHQVRFIQTETFKGLVVENPSLLQMNLIPQPLLLREQGSRSGSPSPSERGI